MPGSSPWRTPFLTLLSLAAFAANSLLCRMALGTRSIDPASFTSVRILSGALVLVPLAKLAAPSVLLSRSGNFRSALALVVYAMAFSLAYVSLNTATGALILFGAVQITMISAGVMRGERFSLVQVVGVVASLSGLAYLLLPSATAPSFGSAALMLCAGVAWGLYSLWGRGAEQPLATSAGNFLRATGLSLCASLLFAAEVRLSPRGILLAATSGAVTSGLGYAIWYRALHGHSATSAAVVQLSVPVLAALAGSLVLSEHPTPRLTVCALLTLGGIAMTLLARPRRSGSH